MSVLIFKDGKLFNFSVGKQYDGEKIPGDLDSWSTYSVDPNNMLRSTFGTMVERSSTLYHTTIIKAFVEKQTTYGIGPGLVFRSQPDYRSIPNMTRESAKDWGKDFQKIVHYYFSKYNFYEKQWILFNTALIFGDSLLFFIRDSEGLQDLVEFGNDQIDWRITDDKDFTLGIKRDNYFRRLGIKKVDGTYVSFKDETGNANLLQFMFKQQARQMRGFPLCYGLIHLIKNDDRHWDAAVQRAVLETIMFGNFETESSDPVQQSRNLAKVNLKAKLEKGEEVKDGFFSRIFNSLKLGGGNMFLFKKGEKIKFSDLVTPSNTFSMFKGAIYDYAGAYTGTPSEVAFSKYNTSYTAHRGTLNDFKINFMYKRGYFKHNVMNPTIEEILKDALLKGYIKAPGFFTNPFIRFAYMQGNCMGPVLGVINPLQEINAEKTAVESAFKLRGDVTLQNGYEWDNFLEEYAQQEEEYSKLSVKEQTDVIANNEGIEAI